MLLDAHSIRGEVPRLFDGLLPDFNIGTNDGKSCATSLPDAVAQVCDAPGYRHVVNGRFKGGHITRHYGQPDRAVHAVQLELAQRTYMNEQPPFDYRRCGGKCSRSCSDWRDDDRRDARRLLPSDIARDATGTVHARP